MDVQDVQDVQDVVVVGGGAAGLSAAVALGRALRSVVVVDGAEPRNAPADGVHNYLTRDGMPPAELLAAGRAEVVRYGGVVLDGTVTRVSGGVEQGFSVHLADGRTVGARRIIVTTGLVDELPEVAGLRGRWGRDVLHCPYCHGWEVRDQALLVLSTGAFAVHQALLFRQWSEDVTLLRHTGPAPSADEREQLDACGITVVEGEVAAVELAADRLSGVRLVSGAVVPGQALVVAPVFTARSEVLVGLGVEVLPVEMGGHVFGSQVVSGPGGATSVPGVWVAGNVGDLRAQVISAAAAGLEAGAMVNADLVTEDVRRAVAAGRELAGAR